MKKLLILLGLILLLSCTENQKARKFGGTADIELTKGYRLVNATWKDSDLWLLTKKNSSIPPTTYIFQEKSNFGMMEGKYIIKEK